MSQSANLRRSKYGNVKCRYKSYVFDSRIERDRFIFLEGEEKLGNIRDLKRQVPLALHGTTGDIIAQYIADFTYVMPDGRQITEDVKSPATLKNDTFRLKKRMYESQYSHRIHIVTKANLTSLPHVYH